VFFDQGECYGRDFIAADHEIVIFQTLEQFEYDGCENCETFLRMKKNRDRVMDVTSNNFDG
jgi:hypothetical protein